MVKRKHVRYNILLAMLLVFVLFMGACSSKTNEGAASPTATTASQDATTATPDATTAPTDAPAATAAPLEPVELSYYYPGGSQAGLQRVEDAMNVILKAKINATVKLNLLDWGAYEQKMNVMTAAGEAYDLAFSAPWFNNYYQNVAKGAFVPLDDLLDKYAPTLKSTVPKEIWDATRIEGKIYGAINWQIVAMPYGIEMSKAAVDKYHIDLDSITKYEDLEPYLDQIKKDVNSTSLAYLGGVFEGEAPFYGMDTIGDDASVGWYHLNDSTIKVVNQYATPEYKHYMELIRRWVQKGYLPKDVVTDTAARWKSGKTVLGLQWPIKPGGTLEDKAGYQIDFVAKTLSKPLITTGRAIATMTAISKTSKNPERAMMFLELLNTDKQLYNILCNGIEGTDYKLTDATNGVIEKVAGSGYNPNTDWMYGNQFNAYYTDPSAAAADNWGKTIELNKTADLAPLLGFNFNPDPVKTEMAQTAAVMKQYGDPLNHGIVDVDKILPEFLDKLNKAGADKIIAEKQKQVDAWLLTKK